ncbi:hypothetical protein MSAN_02194000 [Mycena sanguinolenta]|uniref:Uncharacterized protein n=1 Tax=Mycena sanguinolenta TaxID=230812 RepID=A0A8H6XCB7_9AGAR|nr:hypothetical protein MSAN_02194000 [Mycena sanguinolenta]
MSVSRVFSKSQWQRYRPSTLSTTIMTTLPQELVDNILDYFADDPPSLKIYFLVAREWVPRCRSHLFREYVLFWQWRLTLFCKLLRSPDCTFLPHVRSINKIRHKSPQDYDTHNECAVDLGRLINVHALEMTVATPYSPERFYPFLCTAFPNITRLVLNSGNARRSLPLVSMICLFSALQELDMKRTADVENIPFDAIPPQELCSLSLSRYSAAQILTWLETAGHLPKIHSLVLPPLRGADIPTVCETLKQIGGELHYLDIALCSTAEGAVETLRMIDLSRHRKLQSLHICDGSWMNITDRAQETVLWIPKFIMKLSAPTLERLTLEIDLARPAHNEKFDWAALDAFLSSTRFPHLPQRRGRLRAT